MSGGSYWVYILECTNGSYYTGYTSDLARRYQEHATGTGKCKYTRSFKPLNLAQAWQVKGTKALAMKIEKYIKSRSKQEKRELILRPRQLVQLFAGCKLMALT